MEIRLVRYTDHFYNRRRSGRWCAAKDVAGGAMQNQYVGDIGDFGKYGLLRHLTGMRSDAASGDALSLGVVWYLFPDGGNNDGKFTDYLCNPKPRDKQVSVTVTPSYTGQLSETSCRGECNRNVVQCPSMSGILPRRTRPTMSQMPLLPSLGNLSLPRNSDGKLGSRALWKPLPGSSPVVFVDPDNGIAIPDQR